VERRRKAEGKRARRTGRSSGRLNPAILFLALLSVYLLVGQGLVHIADPQGRAVNVTTSDALIRMALSEQILRYHRLYVPADSRVGRMLPGDSLDPRRFSYFGIAKSLWNLPFMVLSEAIGRVVPPLRGNQTFLVSFSNAPLAALMGVVLFLFLLDLGFSQRVALLSVLVFGLATVTLTHAKYNVSETLAALTLLLTVFHAFRFVRFRRGIDVLLSGVYLGISVHTRPTALLVIPLVLAYFLWSAWQEPAERRRTWAQGLGLFLAMVLLFVALQFAYNQYRYHHWWQFGYSLKGDRFLWNPGFLVHNLVALLVSPGVGLFFYMPVLLFGWAGIRGLYRRHPRETVLLGALFLVYLGVHAAWWYWFAFYAGPRFLAQVHWVWIPFVAQILERWRRLKPIYRTLFWGAVAWGVGVNLLFLWASPRRARYIRSVQAILQHQEVSPVPTLREIWNPLASPLAEQVAMIWDMKARRKIRVVRTPWIRTFFNTPNFWWLHYRHVHLPSWQIGLVVGLLLVLALWSWGHLLRVLGVIGPAPRSP